MPSVTVITSSSNVTIKFIRGLKNRKNRKQSGRFFVEGLRQVGEAVANHYPIEHIVYCPELLTSEFGGTILNQARIQEINVIETNPRVFASITEKEGPQGIAAVCVQQEHDIDEITINGLWVLLDGIQDPGNLGTILRSMDGAGGKGIILCGNSTDPFHPTAVRASMGALFYMPLVKTTPKKFISWKKKTGHFCVGTMCEIGKDFRKVAYPEDMILMMGSEQKGLSSLLTQSCDELVTIPMAGRIDSLNIANAATIVLFEIYLGKNKKS